MAITLLATGSVGPIINQSSFTQPVPLPAGSDRRLVVGVYGSASAPASITAVGVTYGGFTVSNVTDGTRTANRVAGTTLGTSQSLIQCRSLREAALITLPNANNDLTITWAGGTLWAFTLLWWFFNGCDQSVNQRDVRFVETTTAGAGSANVAGGSGFPTDDMVLILASKRDNLSAQALAFDGVGAPNIDLDLQSPTHGYRLGAGRDMSPVSANDLFGHGFTVHGSNQGAQTVGVRMIPFVAPIPGDVSMKLNEPWSVDAGWMP